MNGKKAMKFIIFHVAFCMFVFIPLLAFALVKDTKHNLSITGPGDIKAVTETEICIFCHTPHNASPAQPLWNHALGAVVNYINYASDTLQSYAEGEAPPIDGHSKLCLSCHDGTVAVGSTLSRWGEEIMMVTVAGFIDGSGRLVGGPGYIGTDLSGGHPISIIFDEALAIKRNSADPPLSRLKWPVIDSDIRLHPTQNGYGVQCTSCHDPHVNRAGEWPPFWQKATHDDVCMVCHEAIPPGDIEW